MPSHAVRLFAIDRSVRYLRQGYQTRELTRKIIRFYELTYIYHV